MTDTTQNQAAPNETKGNAPTHIAYHVRGGETGKGFWTRIGSAWANKDGKGFNIQIDVVPLDGRITLRMPEPKDQQ